MINTASQTPDSKNEKLMKIGEYKYKLVVKFKDKAAKEIANILLDLSKIDPSKVEFKKIFNKSNPTNPESAAFEIFRRLKTQNNPLESYDLEDDEQRVIIGKAIHEKKKKDSLSSGESKNSEELAVSTKLSNTYFSAKISEDINHIFNLEISTKKENDELVDEKKLSKKK